MTKQCFLSGKYENGTFHIRHFDSNTEEVKEYTRPSSKLNTVKSKIQCVASGKYENGVFHIKYLEDGVVKTLSYAKEFPKEVSTPPRQDIEIPAFMVERSKQMRYKRELEEAKRKGVVHATLVRLKNQISS